VWNLHRVVEMAIADPGLDVRAVPWFRFVPLRCEKERRMKRKILFGAVAVVMMGTFGFSGTALANPEVPREGCSFPPGGEVAPLHSTATPGGRELVITICSNAGRGEGSEFHGRGGPVPPAEADQDPGGSEPRNRGGD
jgi:hypothetical protein